MVFPVSLHLQLPTDGEDTKLSQSFDYSHTMTKKDYRKWHVELVSMTTLPISKPRLHAVDYRFAWFKSSGY